MRSIISLSLLVIYACSPGERQTENIAQEVDSVIISYRTKSLRFAKASLSKLKGKKDSLSYPYIEISRHASDKYSVGFFMDSSHFLHAPLKETEEGILYHTKDFLAGNLRTVVYTLFADSNIIQLTNYPDDENEAPLEEAEITSIRICDLTGNFSTEYMMKVPLLYDSVTTTVKAIQSKHFDEKSLPYYYKRVEEYRLINFIWHKTSYNESRGDVSYQEKECMVSGKSIDYPLEWIMIYEDWEIVECH